MSGPTNNPIQDLVGKPMTLEEIDELKNKLIAEAIAIKIQEPNCRPLPPMTSDEALDFIIKHLDVARTRSLTSDEAFLAEQGLACYRMAVQGETLKGIKNGKRYIVITQEDVKRFLPDAKAGV